MIRGAATRFTASTAARGRAAKDVYKRRRMAIFADTLSEVGDIKATCKLLGIANSTGSLYMQQIREDLGWQAR